MANKPMVKESSTSLYEQLIMENEAMVKHCLASGTTVPSGLLETLEKYIDIKEGQPVPDMEGAVKQLGGIHSRLSRLVEPAKPSTILLLDRERSKKSIFSFLGAVPFIRRMMLAAIISLAIFIITSLSPAISHDPKDWILFMSQGTPLLLRELFLLSAAGLGAAFTALFRANRYIAEGTFDDKYESSYWVRFIMGIIAGMIIATLIPISDKVATDSTGAKDVVSFSKPLLAMLGGFSTDVVYRVLTRLIEAFSSFISGDKAVIAKAGEREQRARIEEDMSKNRFKLAADVVKLQQDLTNDIPKDEIKKRLAAFSEKLTNPDATES